MNKQRHEQEKRKVCIYFDVGLATLDLTAKFLPFGEIDFDEFYSDLLQP